MRWMCGEECTKIHLFTREMAADGYRMRGICVLYCSLYINNSTIES